MSAPSHATPSPPSARNTNASDREEDLARSRGNRQPYGEDREQRSERDEIEHRGRDDDLLHRVRLLLLELDREKLEPRAHHSQPVGCDAANVADETGGFTHEGPPSGAR